MPLDVRLASNVTMGQGMFGNYNVYIENSEVFIYLKGHHIAIRILILKSTKLIPDGLMLKKDPIISAGQLENIETRFLLMAQLSTLLTGSRKSLTKKST